MTAMLARYVAVALPRTNRALIYTQDERCIGEQLIMDAEEHAECFAELADDVVLPSLRPLHLTVERV